MKYLKLSGLEPLIITPESNFINVGERTNVADHCASSSGKVELPLEKYRIPAMIYAPGFIKPQECNTLMSQIDLMPTTLGLLHFNYKSKFFGQDVFTRYRFRFLY
jgi:phosphoglycerol transferase MdoB-like AlkP superfamily enzyme